MKKYYLLSLYSTDNTKAFPLGLEPRTMAEVESSLSWQKVGGSSGDEFTIAERVGVEKFKCVNTGQEYTAYNGAFIQSAWDEFLNSFEGVQNVN